MLEEINQDYVDQHHIILTRRTSGGGAVYDDLGNVSFSFITKDDGDAVGNFKRFTDPVINALHEMGATSAAMTGRNDLTIEGKKFSGNAMHVEKGRMFSHGTLMYDVDQSVLTKALNVPADKIASKGIKSVRSRVTNLKPHFAPAYQNLTIEEFRDALAKKILNITNIEDANAYVLDDEALAGVHDLEQRYFKNWDWIYGKSPAFNVKRREHFAAGTVEFSLNVDEGHITDIQITGDFFGQADIKDVENRLIGTKYELNAVKRVFDSIDVSKYFGKVTENELVDLLMRQGA